MGLAGLDHEQDFLNPPAASARRQDQGPFNWTPADIDEATRFSAQLSNEAYTEGIHKFGHVRTSAGKTYCVLHDYCDDYLTTYQSTDKIGVNSVLYFVFRGTDTLFDMWRDLNLMINYVDTSSMNAYVAARDASFLKVKAAIEANPHNHTTIFTGHSLGGMMALDCRYMIAKDTQLYVSMANTPGLMVFNPFVLSTPEFVEACQMCDEALASPGTTPWKDALMTNTVVNVNDGDWAPVLFRHQGYGLVKHWNAIDPVDLVGSVLQTMTWGVYNVHANHAITAWTQGAGVSDRPVQVHSHPYALHYNVDDPVTLLDEGNYIAMYNSKSYGNHQLAIRTNPAALAAGNPISANLWTLPDVAGGTIPPDPVAPPAGYDASLHKRFMWQIDRLDDAPVVLYSTQDAIGNVLYHIRYWYMVTEPIANTTFYVSPEYYRPAGVGDYNVDYFLHYMGVDPTNPANAAVQDQILQLSPGLIDSAASIYTQVDPVTGHQINFTVASSVSINDADQLDRALWRLVDTAGVHMMADIASAGAAPHPRRLLSATHYVVPLNYASLPTDADATYSSLLKATPSSELFAIESVEYPGYFLKYNVVSGSTFYQTSDSYIQLLFIFEQPSDVSNLSNEFKFHRAVATTNSRVTSLAGGMHIAEHCLNGPHGMMAANGSTDIWVIDTHFDHTQNWAYFSCMNVCSYNGTLHAEFPIGNSRNIEEDANGTTLIDPTTLGISSVPTNAQFKIVWL